MNKIRNPGILNRLLSLANFKSIIINYPSFYIALKKFKYLLMGLINKVHYKEILQTAPTTNFNRHPDLFKVVSQIYDNEKCKILSYGCSTGEECRSLRQYFSSAIIIGADVNRSSLRYARKTTKDNQIEYIFSNQSNIIEKGKFDIIIAISVLCKNPEAEYLDDISTIYSFDQFEKTIVFFDNILSSNGLLVIRNSNFRFSDTLLSKNYKIYKNSHLREPILFPKFDSNNKRLINYKDDEEIFIKK